MDKLDKLKDLIKVNDIDLAIMIMIGQDYSIESMSDLIVDELLNITDIYKYDNNLLVKTFNIDNNQFQLMKRVNMLPYNICLYKATEIWDSDEIKTCVDVNFKPIFTNYLYKLIRQIKLRMNGQDITTD